MLPHARQLPTIGSCYSTGSQASDALALDMGIVPGLYYQAVLDHLVAGIQAYGTNGYHLSVGEIALPSTPTRQSRRRVGMCTTRSCWRCATPWASARPCMFR